MTVFAFVPRLLTSFAVLLGVYWAYALLIVPIIEPARQLSTRTAFGNAEHMHTTDRYEKLFAALFPVGAWEHVTPKVLETDQGLLLFREHKTLPDGEMEVSPFTLILHAHDDEEQATLSHHKKRKRPIVIRAPDGATLNFDEQLDLARGAMGKLQRARLRGRISIYGPETRAGANDKLNILTHNVHIDQDRIRTSHDVTFRLGPHYGSGRNLTIDLLPKKQPNGQETSTKTFGNVKLLELVHVDRINLQLKGGGLFDEDPTPRTATRENRLPTPVEITCRGPFQFDFLKSVASFEDHVNVMRLNPNGVADQLNCQLLEVHLKSDHDQDNDGTNEVASAPAQESSIGDLDVRRLVAVGHPVTMRAPSRQSQAFGQRLVYDFPTRRITLTAPGKVSMTHGLDQVEAQSIDYTLAEDKQLGSLLAQGPGWIVHRAVADKPGFRARWKRLLDMQPREGRHVVSLLDGAQVAMDDMGQIDADEIFMWLVQQPVQPVTGRGPVPAGGPAVAESQQPNRSGKPHREILPDKLLARGNVTIESTQLSGRTRQLEAWFEHRPVPVADRQPVAQQRISHAGGESIPSSPLVPRQTVTPAAVDVAPADKTPPVQASPGQVATSQITGGPRTAGRKTAAGPPAAGHSLSPHVAHVEEQGKPQHKFDLTGDTIRTKLLLVGRRTEISSIDVAGNVKLVEINGFDLGERPLQINGSALQLVPSGEKLARVHVVGQPAFVAARGMTIKSGRVNLDQATNMMWIDEAGEMTLPPRKPKQQPGHQVAFRNRRQANGRGSQVSWKGSMRFDGRTIHYEKEVLFRGEHLMENGEMVDLDGSSQTLDVSLMQPVSFARNAKARGKKTEIRQLAMDGGVYMENHGRDEHGTAASADRISTRNLIIDYLTGDIRADGRGWMKTVRRGNDQLTQRVGNVAQPQPKKTGEELVFIHVTFDKGITGDVLKRQINFHDNVEAIYGPVARWDDELDPNRRGGLGEQGVALTCDTLTVAEMGPKIDGRRSFELQAVGDTHVEGSRFEATAERVSFGEAKNVVVLEGNSRTNAEIWHQNRVGASRDHAAARKIRYWRDDNRVEVEDARLLDLTPSRTSLRPGQGPRR